MLVRKVKSNSLFCHLIFFLINIGWVLSCSNASVIDRAKQVQIGMSAKEVKHILGNPDDSLLGYFDKSKVMYLYQTPIGSSSDVEIYFEPDSMIVTNVILPKGE